MDRRKALIHCVVEYTLKKQRNLQTFTGAWCDLTKQTDLGGVLCTMQTDYNFQLESEEKETPTISFH